ncbi:hypothetical protein [Nonomuraea rubra]|uniref:Uncharacterized protein n=1 Tax=Nonomuraea rubra TaxID=46180 RepID=A0A7X0P6S9_9ACTN|nr:hypothetical protein [Nonomuraea rubra]MBB6556114.1 hypothetical protein [Nonomuraea rubra]
MGDRAIRNMLVQECSDGSFLATLPCPVAGCGADASMTSRNKNGPYNGACDKGHTIDAPWAKEGPASDR